MDQKSSRKKSKKGIMMGLLILFLIIILIIVLVLVFRNKGTTESKPEPTVQPYTFSNMAHNFDISGNGEGYPLFQNITIDPFYGMAGNLQKIAIKFTEGDNFISSVVANVLDDNGTQSISLSLASRIENVVTWQGEWTIRNISTKDYPITFVAVDKNGDSKQIDIFWTGQGAAPISVKTPTLVDRIKSLFSIQEARAEYINNDSGTNSAQFPHNGEVTINSSIALGTGTVNYPFITGVDNGNVIISAGKTLELKPYTYFIINPGFQIIKQGGSLAIASAYGSGVYYGYLWGKDSDNDGCFDPSTIKYNQNETVSDTAWGTGYKRISTLEYFPDPDDQNQGAAPSCVGSSHNLKITKLGTGNGLVKSSPTGISCGSMCNGGFTSGTTVTLSVVPDATSNFTGWTGDCEDIDEYAIKINDCVVVMDGEKEVKASFDTTSGSIQVTKSGTGEGMVTSDPNGIACGSICNASFDLDDTVVLTANPSTGSSFVGWYNDCSGSSKNCSLAMNTNREVEAKFNLGGTTSHKLTVTKNGSGSIVSSPTGIDCGSDCTHYYSPNTVVTLTATPLTGGTFTGWAGACTGTNTTCSVTMSQSKSVTANFSTYFLTVNKSGTGTGTITSYPSGINCGLDCTQEYIAGLEILLTPSVDVNSQFTGWTGCTNLSENNVCRVTMNSSKTVTAAFIPAGNTITIQKTGSGSGTITSSPAGIDCGSTCTKSYPTNTIVSLTASPLVGSSFIGWAGVDGCTTSTSCTFNVTSSKTISAIFSTTIATSYTLVVSNSGNGIVASSPAGIDCGSTCSANLSINSTIVLHATPNTGYVFSGWTGACSGTGTCTVTMDNSKVVGAVFASSITQYALNVSKTGTGSGTVTSNSPIAGGIVCGSDCAEPYVSGSTVTLSYVEDENSDFISWSGACTGTASTCTVLMNEAKTVTARFDRETSAAYSLAISVSGSGLVVSSPAGINCTSALCVQTFAEGTSVTLTATAQTAAVFEGWEDDCTGTGTTCTIVMNSNKGALARFSTASYALTVSKTGNGQGSLISMPGGITCSNSCVSYTHPFAKDTTVVMTATPKSGSKFVKWTGACDSTVTTCSVVMDNVKDLGAEFGVDSYTLNAEALGTGYGLIKSSTEDIKCGTLGWMDETACSKTYTSVTSVTLTAQIGVGSKFTEWSGDCTGTNTTCTVSVDGVKNVKATFTLDPTYVVTVVKTGSGTGKVTGPGITCGTDCDSEWVTGTSITLKATPDSGSSFTEWSGDCMGSTSNSCTLVMDGEKTVTVMFTSNASVNTSSGSIKLPECSVSVGSGVWARNQYYDKWETNNMCKIGTSCTKKSGCVSMGTSGILQELSSLSGLSGIIGRGFTFGLRTGTDGTAGGLVNNNFVVAGICMADQLHPAFGAPTELCVSGNSLSYLPACPFDGTIGTVYAKDESCDWSYKCELNTTCSKICKIIHILKTNKGYYNAWCGMGNCNYCVVNSGTTGGGGGSSSYTLDVNTAGSGLGTITATGIVCGYGGSVCSKSYTSGTSVQLTAAVMGTSVWGGWSGDCTGTGSCTVTMDQARSVTATFNQGSSSTKSLTVNKTGTGAGTVTSSPSGINCGSTCNKTYTSTTSVTLTATASSGSTFVEWSGNCSGTSSTCTVSVSSAKTVTATFNNSSTAKYTLTVNLGGGGGWMTSVPSGISCGSGTCSYAFNSGTPVTLNVTLSSGKVISSWGGACSGTNTSCVVTMTGDKSATVTFANGSGGGGGTTTCTNDCYPTGSRACSLYDTYKTCGQYDSDECLDWSQNYSCGGIGNPGTGGCSSTKRPSWSCRGEGECYVAACA